MYRLQWIDNSQTRYSQREKSTEEEEEEEDEGKKKEEEEEEERPREQERQVERPRAIFGPVALDDTPTFNSLDSRYLRRKVTVIPLMSPARLCHINGTLTPFLYPFLTEQCLRSIQRSLRSPARRCNHYSTATTSITSQDPLPTTPATTSPSEDEETIDLSYLDPSPESYSLTPFTDHCTLQLNAGAGGHGCVAFLREKYIAAGPANGGDGGSGGNVYIQAVRGETSLHKLARRGILKAGRGKNGQGKGQGGERGDDLLVTVPVGTVVREIWRQDRVADEEERYARERGSFFGADSSEEPAAEGESKQGQWRRDKWLLYPGALPSSFTTAEFPALPRPRKSNLTMSQPQAPIKLDLDKPMEAPMLLAAGAMGGLGNPHFVTRSIPRPKFATKGEVGMRLQLQLELKLLADVGLVGLPNAGKSTLLRAITNSRPRVGNWAFTTLQPNIGTVVLDNHKGRPGLRSLTKYGEPRTSFSIADIPGLIEDAHLDKGLGLGFLRHIERAAVLAFVVDLSAGDAVAALQGLWNEVGEYESLRDHDLNIETETRIETENGLVKWKPMGSGSISPAFDDDDDPGTHDPSEPFMLDAGSARELPPLSLPPISAKPWFVVATKADLPETRENFAALQAYLKAVADAEFEHPSRTKNAWRKNLHAVPVSAIKAEGVSRIPEVVVQLLDE
ncbi:hypothetical protein B0A49_00553 [Cryomyces minteri]|uniref:Obg family GTPase CgtA n=1 Tax=Cryomyces minteri TaxID=331657 RepID=A0A4U0XXV1_9PEZI|nr:hypothetical protein B0A49_00553 [Cryomyces minteri]